MKYLILISLIFSSISLKAQDEILGNFWTPDKDGKVEILKRGNKYYGKLTYATHPGKDINNPDPKKRNLDVVGSEFIKDLVFDKKNSWIDGSIYDARSGKSYNCDVTLLENGDLKVRGYVGFSLLGQSVTFYRIK